VTSVRQFRGYVQLNASSVDAGPLLRACVAPEKPGSTEADPARDDMELFDDFYDASTSRLHDHRPIVHDRVPVARRHMILAGYRVKRYASRG